MSQMVSREDTPWVCHKLQLLKWEYSFLKNYPDTPKSYQNGKKSTPITLRNNSAKKIKKKN